MLHLSLTFLKWLENCRTEFGNVFLGFFTHFGEETVIFAVLCLFYWCYNKKFAYHLGLVFFASGVLLQDLKVIFRIERPWVLDSDIHPVASALDKATGYSFPSGHTQGATSLYGTVFCFVKNRWLKALMVALTLTVGFSRMYLGVHTPLDVGVALIMTGVIVWLLAKCGDKLQNPAYDVGLSVVLGAISVGLCVHSYLLASVGAVDFAQINDCFKCGGAGFGFALSYLLERKTLNFDVHTPKKWMQIPKFVLGIGVAVGLKSALKLIAPNRLPMDFFRYFVTVLWILYLYPLLFTSFFRNKQTASPTQKGLSHA